MEVQSYQLHLLEKATTMYCPGCESENVYVMIFLSWLWQVRCVDCRKEGTFTEFHALEYTNQGLVQTPDGAILIGEEEVYEALDPTSMMRITAHRVGSDAVYNVWVCAFRQWMKMIPERVIPNSEVTIDGLQSEIMRLINHEPMGRYLRGNRKMQEAIRILMERFSRKDNTVAVPQVSNT